jgi:UDP-N-acetylmuramate--alanine ligase
MIAFCLDRLALDPAFLVGGEIPQLGGNARAGEGWLVAEGDESDRSLLLLQPRIAVVTNVDLDHHATFASLAEVEALFETWLASLPADAVVVRGEVLPPAEIELAVPGEHNLRNAACALAALELAGFDREAAAEALAGFRGAGRRLEAHGSAGGVLLVDDYAHHPAELAATIAAARELTDGKLVVLFQPHLYTRTLHLGRELGEALAAADAAVVTEIYAAREEPLPGVTAKVLVDRLLDARPGMQVGWAPSLADAARLAADLARPGGLLLTAGAGDVDTALPLVGEALLS